MQNFRYSYKDTYHRLEKLYKNPSNLVYDVIIGQIQKYQEMSTHWSLTKFAILPKS